VDHLTYEAIEAFIERVDSDDEARAKCSHLQTCRLCREKLGVLAGEEIVLDGAIDRALAAVRPHLQRHAVETAHLDRILARLVDQPEGILDISCRQGQTLRGWPIVEALLQCSFALRYRDPAQMVVLARLAQICTEDLDVGVYPAPLVADFKARAWIELGNALRVNQSFGEAETAIARAARLLPDGTGNPLLAASLADVEAALRARQRRLSEALSRLDESLRI
jgi:hypothetical protein